MISTQVIRPDIKSQVRKDDELMLVLAKANKVRVGTVERWFREDDETLTTVKNLEIIRQGLKLGKSAKLTQDAA